MFQKLLANKHLRLRDSRLSLVRPSGDLGLSTRKKKIKNKSRVEQEPRSAHGRAVNKKPRCGCNRALKPTVTHTVRLRFCYFLIFTQTPVQFVKRDIVTAVIYCYITTEFHFAKRDSRCLSFLGFPLQLLQVVASSRLPQQILNTSLHSLR